MSWTKTSGCSSISNDLFLIWHVWYAKRTWSIHILSKFYTTKCNTCYDLSLCSYWTGFVTFLYSISLYWHKISIQCCKKKGVPVSKIHTIIFSFIISNKSDKFNRSQLTLSSLLSKRVMKLIVLVWKITGKWDRVCQHNPYYLAVLCCVVALDELPVCEWDSANVANTKLASNALSASILSTIGLEYEKKIHKIISVTNERCQSTLALKLSTTVI